MLAPQDLLQKVTDGEILQSLDAEKLTLDSTFRKVKLRYHFVILRILAAFKSVRLGSFLMLFFPWLHMNRNPSVTA
jgi:hypothetical protein